MVAIGLNGRRPWVEVYLNYGTWKSVAKAFCRRESCIMHYRFRPLRWREAWAIAFWRYEGQYAFYDPGPWPLLPVVALRPLLAHYGIEMWGVHGEPAGLVGAFAFVKRGDRVRIVLAMRPDLTGTGFGQGFVQAGLDFATARLAPTAFRLNVAAFNRRAIAVYTRVGFHPTASFRKRTHGVIHEFLAMTWEVPAR
jgi:[ribosomal protein S18]-alanine N-acetyltransferase